MQTVLKQFCYPVNFLACACSRKIYMQSLVSNSFSMFLNILTGIGACSKKAHCQKSLKYMTSLLIVTLLSWIWTVFCISVITLMSDLGSGL